MAERKTGEELRELCGELSQSSYFVESDAHAIGSAVIDALRFGRDEVVPPRRVELYVRHRDEFEQDLLKLGDPKISALLKRHQVPNSVKSLIAQVTNWQLEEQIKLREGRGDGLSPEDIIHNANTARGVLQAVLDGETTGICLPNGESLRLYPDLPLDTAEEQAKILREKI